MGFPHPVSDMRPSAGLARIRRQCKSTFSNISELQSPSIAIPGMSPIKPIQYPGSIRENRIKYDRTF